MKTIKDVRTFFENDLTGELNEFEQLRLGINKRYSFKHYRTTLKILGALALTAIVVSMARPDSPLRWGTALVPFTAVVAIAYPVILWSLRAARFKSINRAFKAKIIPRLLTFVQPGMTYMPDQGFQRSDILNSALFENENISVRSGDLVHGTVGGVKVRFADVSIIGRTRQSTKGKRFVVFSGLFFQADLERNLSSNTIVEPDIREGMGLKLAKKILGENAGDTLETFGERIESLQSDLVRMEDFRFERYFSVYSQNEKEARTVLTPSLMHVLADFREKNDLIAHLSFAGRHLNLAIDAPDMFESGVEESFLRFESFSDYLEILLLVLRVVKEIPPVPLVAPSASVKT